MDRISLRSVSFMFWHSFGTYVNVNFHPKLKTVMIYSPLCRFQPVWDTLVEQSSILTSIQVTTFEKVIHTKNCMKIQINFKGKILVKKGMSS